MSKKGIDVSEFQGKIDWEKVKNDGIEFAILRCGYGMDFSNQDDVEYERNANECERLGIPYGVYLMSYANTVEKARSEAKHVLRLIEGRKISLGVWHDIEDNGTSGAINKETLTNIINTFCNTIKNAGYKVGVYANLNWLENKIEKTIKDNYDIWVAQYYNKCEYEGKYIMWQHTSSGKVNGISTNVDMNILYEDLPVINNNDNNNSKTNNSEIVKSLQRALNKDYNCGLDVDGIIGPLTTKAVNNNMVRNFTVGEFAKWVQERLIAKGYSLNNFGVDGRYGNESEKKVKEFQANCGIDVDGIVGINTVNRLIGG